MHAEDETLIQQIANHSVLIVSDRYLSQTKESSKYKRCKVDTGSSGYLMTKSIFRQPFPNATEAK